MAEVTVEDKKAFLRWFLKNHTLKRRECVWIINYLLSYDNLMEKVHFVVDCQVTPNGMFMSTNETSTVPFRFFIGRTMTTDAEKGFYHIRSHKEDELYVTINFEKRYLSDMWYSVLEENPHSKGEELVETPEINKDRMIVDNLVECMTFDAKMLELSKRIDKALEEGDRDTFMALTDERNFLLEIQPGKLYTTGGK